MGARESIVRALLAGKPGGPHPGGIHVYHSSPHDFDKFDWSKLRTGEGANMYGSGFYFAENPAVSGQGGEYWKAFHSNKFEGPEYRAAERLQGSNFDRATAIERAQKDIADWQSQIARNPDLEAMYAKRIGIHQDALRLLESGGPVGPRTYEVNINARPELMLDWDKPVSAQTPHVKDVLSTKFGWEPDSYTLPSGKLAPRIGAPIGATAYNDLQLGLANKYAIPDRGRAASEALADAGIPGIRYLDEGSRTRVARNNMYHLPGEGDLTPPTYNYVVTDPSKLDILGKYGVVGTAGGGLSALAAQDQYGETRP